MPGRQFVGATGYSYGFGGQLKDDEISGNGNSYTAEYWQYDPRLGRRWNKDGIVKEWESPYATFANNPLWFIDPNGNDTITFNRNSTSFDAKPSKLDGYPSFQPTGTNSFNINVTKAEGEDVFYYTQSHTHYNAEGTESNTTSLTVQLFPNTDSRSGATEGTNMMFDGMIGWQESDLDYISIGKFMNSSDEFSSYLETRNPKAKEWKAMANGKEIMDGLLPSFTVSIAANMIPWSSVATGGKTFEQYRYEYWSTREKPILRPLVNPNTGQTYKVYMELHHVYIPQRAAWAPNWLKNNSWNLRELNSIEHGLQDPFRFQFFPKWVKEGVKSGTIKY